MLFSATQTKKVEDLAKLALSKEPLYVGVDDNMEAATNVGLQQVRAARLTHQLCVVHRATLCARQTIALHFYSHF
jgi:superfamily II DNA/RNA helicase